MWGAFDTRGKMRAFFLRKPEGKITICRPINLNVNQNMNSILYLIIIPRTLFFFIVRGFS
jgi:hypothetical protein